jgi:hypothetical protein
MPPLLGVHEREEDVPTERRAQEFPGHAAVRIFAPGVITNPFDLVPKIDRQCAAAWRAGHTAVWSFKPHPRHVAEGRWDTHLTALGTHLREHRRDKPTIVVIWHEPERDLGTYFDTPEAFVRMFNTVHRQLTAAYPRLTTCHAALNYAYRDGGFDDAMARRWRTSARLKGIDAYSGRSFPLKTILPELSGYQRWRRCVVRNSRRWAAIERGWTCPETSCRQRAQTIEREFDWLSVQDIPPEVYMIWGSTGVEGDLGLALDPLARAAVAAGFTRLAATGTVQGLR